MGRRPKGVPPSCILPNTVRHATYPRRLCPFSHSGGWAGWRETLDIEPTPAFTPTLPLLIRVGRGPFPPGGGRTGWGGEARGVHPHPHPPPSRGREGAVGRDSHNPSLCQPSRGRGACWPSSQEWCRTVLILPRKGKDCCRTYHGYSLISSQEGCYEADGCVRGAAVFSPVPLARKWGMTYFPKRRREFITSAWVAGPAWKMGMISVAPISS
jgi:hypothetical protein